MRLNHPQSGKLQQGAVVNCIAVPGYENCDCHGIVLTARCDLEHEKHSVINYLPIVLCRSDWVPRRMCYIVAKRLRKSLDSSISRVLAQKGVSNFVREVFPLEDIITHETKANERKSLLQKCSHLKLVEEVLALDDVFCRESKDLFSIDKAMCDTVVKELIQQKLGEYYFLGAAEVLYTNLGGARHLAPSPADDELNANAKDHQRPDRRGGQT